MKYAVSNLRSPERRRAYIVSDNEELTYIAWQIEGRAGTHGRYWRELALRYGIVDPMQSAGSPGNDERFLLGERLRLGQELLI